MSCAGSFGTTLRGRWRRSRQTPHRRSSRQGRLIGRSLAAKTVKGKVLDQWQYKVGASAGIWYCIDEEEMTVWVTYASTRHPKATE